MYINTNTNLIVWDNLHKGLCPKCNGVLFDNTYGFFKCSDCTFKIGSGKFADMVKGKQSTAYRKVLKQRKQAQKFYKKEKTRLGQIIEQQNKERESNLRRMQAKGLI